MNEIEQVKIVKHINGDLKDFYTAEIIGFKGQIMKNKSLSTLLGKVSKWFRSQGN